MKNTYTVKGAQYYNNIQNSARPIEKRLEIAKGLLDPDGGIRFLDVGSGTGNIMSIALKLGFDAFGIEYMIELAVESATQIKERTTYVDALEFKGYGEFDLIYFYQPIKSSAEMIRLIDTINEQASNDTLFVPYVVLGDVLSHIKTVWEKVDSGIYVRRN